MKTLGKNYAVLENLLLRKFLYILCMLFQNFCFNFVLHSNLELADRSNDQSYCPIRFNSC
jgi:hypothetical protein